MVNYSTLLCFDSMLSYNTSVQNNIVMTTATEAPCYPRLVVALTFVTSTEEVPTHQSGTSPYKIL